MNIFYFQGLFFENYNSFDCFQSNLLFMENRNLLFMETVNSGSYRNSMKIEMIYDKFHIDLF